MKNLIFLMVLSILVASCTSSKKSVQKSIAHTIASSFYKNQFTGFLVIDPISRDTIYNHNSEKYFTPASNTKIFTLYAALKILPDAIPALKYVEQNDTLFFEGTGDPSFLHPYLQDSTAFKFLAQHKNVVYHPNNFMDTKLGPGWAWDDFDLYYSPERNALPIFGNVLTISRTDSLRVVPNNFRDSVVEIDFVTNRALNKNLFYFDAQRADTLEVPFRTDTKTIKNILEKSLNREIGLTMKMPQGEKKILPGIKADSLYVRLMHQSDNFIAEQLLVLAASEITDTLNSEKARNYILKNNLADMPHQPRWVDGSGLSRYNLFTPQSMVYVLQKLYEEVPKERLFTIFPTGGDVGTLRNWYKETNEPYLYAKSGSLSNNHNLSGYLLTKSGKTLIFSFMNNHFRNPSSEIKKRMQRVFEEIRDTY